jgi:hypothetical protein
MTDIEQNLAQVRERMAEAALRAGRDPAAVTLVAVSKTFPVAYAVEAYHCGVRDLGENRVGEGMEKIPAVNAELDGPPPTWHMIGHIQSRKARDVPPYFDYVHSVDRLKIARRLSRYAQEAGRTLPVLLECNVSGEESKYGFDLADWRTQQKKRQRFFDAVEAMRELPGISIRGLMTMAPFVDDEQIIRPVFTGLRALQETVRERFPDIDWQHLSMGMTDDFEIAIEEGSTMVRIGRAIFGARQY